MELVTQTGDCRRAIQDSQTLTIREFFLMFHCSLSRCISAFFSEESDQLLSTKHCFPRLRNRSTFSLWSQVLDYTPRMSCLTLRMPRGADAGLGVKWRTGSKHQKMQVANTHRLVLARNPAVLSLTEDTCPNPLRLSFLKYNKVMTPSQVYWKEWINH